MSHLVKQSSNVQIKSLDLLSRAVTRLGGVLHQDKKVATYYRGQTTKCDAVATFPGTTYEIAVHKKESGYELEADLYCQTLKAAVGKDCGKLYLGYKTEELNKEARLNNWTVKENFNSATNQVELTYQRF